MAGFFDRMLQDPGIDTESTLEKILKRIQSMKDDEDARKRQEEADAEQRRRDLFAEREKIAGWQEAISPSPWKTLDVEIPGYQAPSEDKTGDIIPLEIPPYQSTRDARERGQGSEDISADLAPTRVTPSRADYLRSTDLQPTLVSKSKIQAWAPTETENDMWRTFDYSVGQRPDTGVPGLSASRTAGGETAYANIIEDGDALSVLRETLRKPLGKASITPMGVTEYKGYTPNEVTTQKLQEKLGQLGRGEGDLRSWVRPLGEEWDQWWRPDSEFLGAMLSGEGDLTNPAVAMGVRSNQAISEASSLKRLEEIMPDNPVIAMLTLGGTVPWYGLTAGMEVLGAVGAAWGETTSIKKIPFVDSDMTVGMGWSVASRALRDSWAMALEANGINANTDNMLLSGNALDPNDLEGIAKEQHVLYAAAMEAIFRNPQTWQSIVANAIAQQEASMMVQEPLRSLLTKNEVEIAESIGVMMGHHGIDEAGAAVQQYASQIQAEKYHSKMSQWYYEKASSPGMSEEDRDTLLIWAAYHGGKVLEQQHKGILDTYYDNANWYKAIPFEIIGGPDFYLAPVIKLAKQIPILGKIVKAAPIVGDTGRQVRETKIVNLLDQALETEGGSIIKMFDLVDQRGPSITYGATGDWIDIVKDGFISKMEIGRSKAKANAYYNASALTGVLPEARTVGDVKTILKYYMTEPKAFITGIPADEFTSPYMRARAGVDGKVRLGYAWLNDPRVVNAAASLKGKEEWITRLPSLMGDPNDVVNLPVAKAEILDMLLHAGGSFFDVNTVGPVPYGAQGLRVKPLDNTTSIIEFTIGKGKNIKVIGNTDAYLTSEANKLVKQWGAALKKGNEFTVNAMSKWSDWTRSMTSNTVLDSSLRPLYNNAVGGNMLAYMFDVLTPTTLKNIDAFYDTKFGGAPGARFIGDTASIFGPEAWRGTGLARGKYNPLRIVKQLRQGRTAAGPVKIGEEAVALTVHYAASKQYFGRNWERLGPKVLDRVLEAGGITDKRLRKTLAQDLIEIGRDGGAEDLHKAFMDIAAGRQRLTVSRFGRAYSEVLGPETKAINDLLATVTPENQAFVIAEIEKILDDKLAGLTAGAFDKVHSGKRILYTSADSADLVKDFVSTMMKLEGVDQPTSEIKLAAAELEKGLANVNDKLLTLANYAGDDPQKWEHIVELHNQLDDLRTQYQVQQGMVAADLHEAGQIVGVNTPEYQGVHLTYQNELDDLVNELDEASNNLIELTRQQLASNAPVTPQAKEALLARLHEKATIDVQSHLDFLKKNRRTVGNQRALQAQRIAAGRKAVEGEEARLTIVMRNNPSIDALDHVTAAHRDTAMKHRSAIRAGNTYFERYVAPITQNGSGASKSQKNTAWRKYYAFTDKLENEAWEYNVKRLRAAQLEIVRARVEREIGEEAVGELRYTKERIKILGKSLTPPKKGEAPQYRIYNYGTDNVGYLPEGSFEKEHLKRYEMLRAQLERRIADAYATIIPDWQPQLGPGATDIDKEIAKVITNASNKEHNDIWQQLMAEAAGMSTNKTIPGLAFGDEVTYTERLVETFRYLVRNRIEDIAAKTKGQTFAELPIDAVKQFNDEVLTLYSNILQSARSFGDEMVSATVLDYLHEYIPDVIFGTRIPYMYFLTRGGKQITEATMRHPRKFSAISKYYRALHQENWQSDQPDRNWETLPGIKIGNTNIRFRDPIGSAVPVLSKFLMSGFVSPWSANENYEYAMQQLSEGALPEWAPQAIRNYVAGTEVEGYIGIGAYPYQDIIAELGIAAATGRKPDIAIGALNPILGTLGWGAAAVMGRDIPGITPGHTPYLYERQVRINLAEGRYATVNGQKLTPIQQEAYADAVVSYYQQWATGQPIEPGLAEVFPTAFEDAQRTARQVNIEYMIRTMWNGTMPISVAPITDTEQDLNKLETEADRMGVWDPSIGVYGGSTGRNTFTDPDSSRYNPAMYLQQNKAVSLQEDRENIGTRALREWNQAELQKLTTQAKAAEKRAVQNALNENPNITAKELKEVRKAAGQPFWEQYNVLQEEVQEKYPYPEYDGSYDPTARRNPLENKIKYTNDAYNRAVDRDNKRFGPPPEWDDNFTKSQSAKFTQDWEDYERKREDAFVAEMTASYQPNDAETIRMRGGPWKMTENQARSYWRERRDRYRQENWLPVERMIIEQEDRTKSPLWEDNTLANYADAESRIPGSTEKLDAYYALDPQERPAAKDSDPELRSMILAAYDPEVYDKMEEKFGKGAVEEYYRGLVNKPEYPEEDATDEEKEQYYKERAAWLADGNQRHPELAFWLNGRSDWRAGDFISSSVDFEYNAGRDYEKISETLDDESRTRTGMGIWELQEARNAAAEADPDNGIREFYNKYPDADVLLAAFSTMRTYNSDVPETLSIQDLEKFMPQQLSYSQRVSRKEPSPATKGEPSVVENVTGRFTTDTGVTTASAMPGAKPYDVIPVEIPPYQESKGEQPSVGMSPLSKPPLQINPPGTGQRDQQVRDVQLKEGTPYADSFIQYGQEYNINPAFLAAVARNESNFDPDALSPASAKGVMQFMPETWGDMQRDLGVDDITDPEQNIRAGAYYLSESLPAMLPDDKQSPQWILAAYNWGPGYVAEAKSWDEVPPETKAYVKRILAEAQPGQIGYPLAEQARLTQGYGQNAANYKRFGLTGHDGVDFGVPTGTDVLAAASGEIIKAGNDPQGYGNYIVIEHSDGMQTLYGHLSAFNVERGDKVKAGQIIGLSGNTGNSTGDHLHFGLIQKGAEESVGYDRVDPMPLLRTLAKGESTKVAKFPLPSMLGGVQGEVVHRDTEPGQTSATEADLAPTRVRTKPPALSDELPEVGQVRTEPPAISQDLPDDIMSLAMLNEGFAEWENRKIDVANEFGEDTRDLYEQYLSLDKDAKAEFKAQNPILRAVTVLTWKPETYAEWEGKFGQDVIMQWANTPRWDGSGTADQLRKAHFQQYPDAFLAGAWLNGRPEPGKEDIEEITEDVDWEYNAGKDYAEAERRFGQDVWDVVRMQKSLPDDKKVRAQFYEDNPKFSQWADWWYAGLPAREDQGRSYGYGYSGGSGFSGFSKPDNLDRGRFSYPQEMKRVSRPKIQAWRADRQDSWSDYIQRVGPERLRRWID